MAQNYARETSAGFQQRECGETNVAVTDFQLLQPRSNDRHDSFEIVDRPQARAIQKQLLQLNERREEELQSLRLEYDLSQNNLLETRESEGGSDARDCAIS